MIFSLKNIHLTLGKETKLERKIIKNLSFSISNDGEFIALIGGNGSGKSTLLKLISGFLKPDSGLIYLDNIEVTNQTKRNIAKVMQDPRIGTMENLTILENMAFAFKRGERRFLTPFSTQNRISFFKDQLKKLNMGLEDRLNESVFNLSGGQRQALSLIMSVMKESRLLLLDEITAALDPKTSKHIMNLTNKIVKEEKRTCIMVTHDLHHAIQFADRILLLKNGQISNEFLETKNLNVNELLTFFS